MLSEENVGETVRVAGWVENIRDHGGVSFIDLRDMYGVLQVVMRDTTLLEGINKEDCISLEGVIEHRDEETYNPKIPTGTIELEAHKVDMLGKVYKQLPFEVMTSKENHENVRLKYHPESTKVSSMHFHKLHSSTNSFLWCLDLINISRLLLASVMRMPEQTVLQESSISQTLR